RFWITWAVYNLVAVCVRSMSPPRPVCPRSLRRRSRPWSARQSVGKSLSNAHEGRWKDSCVRGFLTGHRGVSGVLGFVGGQGVLWSEACDGVASAYDGNSPVPRYSHYKTFWRKAAIPRIRNALKEDVGRRTTTSNMTSAQKVSLPQPYDGIRTDHKLRRTAKELKKANEGKSRLVERILAMRKECVQLTGEQGEAVHNFLVHEDTRRIFDSKLPEGSDQRHFYDARWSGCTRWNTTEGKARGFRFNTSTLRLAVYIQGIAGTAAYNLLRNVIHLPSPQRIKELRRNAAPPRVGVLVENIQKYGKMAAFQDADKATLTGVLAWDLMHLNKNGFSFAPNGGGLTGLVDTATFFNPIFNERCEEERGLKTTLEKIVATQYVEMFFVSLGKPEYKFVVWREAIRSLSTVYIQRMVMTAARYLACAHEDKGFDVIATVCDGASEHRSFQTHAATVTFEAFCEGEREIPFAGFAVGFLHPVHLHEILNMSDPMHILKKIVNALWHSDISHKKRELGMWRVNHEIQFDGDTLTPEERAATLTTFRKLEPGIFHRDNHNCMNVQISARVVFSGTIVGAIRKCQADRERRGQHRDLALEGYEELASMIDLFVDIFNG
ncbi:unnamed protein product, partial [Hapterophycus canaliculatus]